MTAKLLYQLHEAQSFTIAGITEATTVLQEMDHAEKTRRIDREEFRELLTNAIQELENAREELE